MSYTAVAKSKQTKTMDGIPVSVTTTLHTKNPNGLRTVRAEYSQNMPARFGGWLAGTVTERVIEGTGTSTKTIIPEHRVA